MVQEGGFGGSSFSRAAFASWRERVFAWTMRSPAAGDGDQTSAGLIGTFALYHQPLAPTTAVVLIYHAISLWVPASSAALPSYNRVASCSGRPIWP
jgi:hypothetical protein